MPRQLIFILCALFLAACGTVSTSTPTQTPESTNTIAPPTATTTSTATPDVTDTPIIAPTSTPGSHLTVVPTVRPLSQEALNSFPQVTAIPASDSFPTLIPTMQPETISAELQVALQFRDLDAVDGRQLYQITGWKNNYRFSWIDTNHLLLYLKIGEYENNGRNREYQPAVVNLSTNKIWIPRVKTMKINDYIGIRYIPHWSADLGIFIVPNEDKGIVDIYNLEGKKLKTYQGILTSVSPSGTKILINRNTWINLINGKTVEFAWKEYCGGNDLYPDYALWSSDETQVYVSTWGCQIHYGNALTGESHEEAGYAGEYHGTWVLNDKYMLVQWNSVDDGSPGYLPLFDPLEKTFHSLNALVGIPIVENFIAPSCFISIVAPGGRYLWTICHDIDDANYLIDLATLQVQVYRSEEPLTYEEWSLDGNFLVLRQGYDNKPTFSILSVASKELRPLPIEPVYDPMLWWHPTKGIVAYLAKDNKSLVLLDAETMFVREVVLPSNFCNYRNSSDNIYYSCVEWTSSGDRLVLKAEDGSLWQIDYPKLETLEQLTPSGAYDFDWSPDGTKLAFINNAGVFILEVGANP